MKRFIALCMAGVMLMSAPVFADGIVYEGQQIQYSSQEPVIIGSRTYVPIRDVFEKLGFEVDWDADTKIVGLSNDYHEMILTTGTSKIIGYDVYLNINAKKLENPVQIVNGRTMLPLREILESAGYEIKWDAATKTTTIVDINDYEALDAQAERVENLQTINKEYEVDSSKPVGKLTAEEKAYLENLYTILSGEKYEELGESIDLDGENPAQVKAAMKIFVETTKKDLDAVECPESLKAVDAAARKTIDGLANKIISISGIGEILEGETDKVKGQLGLTLGLLSMVSVAMETVGTMEELNSFYAQGNIDPEAELGDLYNSYGR